MVKIISHQMPWHRLVSSYSALLNRHQTYAQSFVHRARHAATRSAASTSLLQSGSVLQQCVILSRSCMDTADHVSFLKDTTHCCCASPLHHYNAISYNSCLRQRQLNAGWVSRRCTCACRDCFGEWFTL